MLPERGSDDPNNIEELEDQFADYDGIEDEDEEWEFDCHASFDRRGRFIGCGRAGSEECEFECPYLREFEREAEARAKNEKD